MQAPSSEDRDQNLARAIERQGSDDERGAMREHAGRAPRQTEREGDDIKERNTTTTFPLGEGSVQGN